MKWIFKLLILRKLKCGSVKIHWDDTYYVALNCPLTKVQRSNFKNKNKKTTHPILLHLYYKLKTAHIMSPQVCQTGGKRCEVYTRCEVIYTYIMSQIYKYYIC